MVVDVRGTRKETGLTAAKEPVRVSGAVMRAVRPTTHAFLRIGSGTCVVSGSVTKA